MSLYSKLIDIVKDNYKVHKTPKDYLKEETTPFQDKNVIGLDHHYNASEKQLIIIVVGALVCILLLITNMANTSSLYP